VSYLDFSWAELRALTRQRRAETPTRPRTLYFGCKSAPALTPENREFMRLWLREQIEAGNDRCLYCRVQVQESFRRTCEELASVDHRIPRAAGGRDHPSNFVVACRLCNGTKDSMSEGDFRRLHLPSIIELRIAEQPFDNHVAAP
jgi:5-methylcytosine-specific restriction endonuclease McrA